MTSKELEAAVWAEGFEPLPYRDSKGIWTIGIGYNMEAHGIPPDWVRPILSKIGITRAAAAHQLEILWERAKDLAIHEVFPTKWPFFSDIQRFVITDMIFNMGLGDSKRGFLSFKNSIQLMKEGNWTQVCINLRRSKWYRDTKSRAKRDIQMLEKGRFLTDEELNQCRTY